MKILILLVWWTTLSICLRANEKEKNIERILERLYDVSLQLKGMPSIVLDNNSDDPSEYNFSSNTIHINESDYDLCMSMQEYGETALSIIIGHELAHHFSNSKDMWVNFSDSKDLLNFGQLGNDAIKRRDEIYADINGLKYTYLIGLNPFNNYDKFLRLLIKKYKNGERYLKINDRKICADNLRRRIESSKKTLCVANTLIEIGDISPSIIILNKLLDTFGCSQVYNSLGVAYALKFTRNNLNFSNSSDYKRAVDFFTTAKKLDYDKTIVDNLCFVLAARGDTSLIVEERNNFTQYESRKGYMNKLLSERSETQKNLSYLSLKNLQSPR